MRNDKANPPIVKVMRYRIELIKRLLKKLSKNKEFKLKGVQENKFLSIPVNIEENDLYLKVSKSRELLRNFSHLKIAIFCDLLNNDTVYKATNILNHMAENLSDVCKISKNVGKKFQSKIDERNSGNIFDKEENTTSIKDQIIFSNEEQEQRELEESLLDKKYDKKNAEDYNYEDVDYHNCMYLELESMLIDTSGIDYELILNSTHIEDILTGLKNNSFLASNKVKKQKEENLKTDEFIDSVLSSKEAENNLRLSGLEEKLKQLEQTLEEEDDFYKRLQAGKNLKEMKNTLELEKLVIETKLIIKKSYYEAKRKLRDDPSDFQKAIKD